MVRDRKFKKDRIIELMDKGKSANEVASMLGTSESYVNKVRSINRSGSAISSNSKSEDISIPFNSDLELTNKPRKGRSKNIQLPTISPPIRKSLYRWLDKSKPLVDFIKLTGVDGRVLEEEYEIYLKFKDSDRFELQKKLLSLVGRNEDEIESIVSGAPSNLLTNFPLLELLQKGIEEIKRKFAEVTMAQRMETKKYTLPSMYKRPKCSNCGQELMGVLIDNLYLEDLHLLRHLNSVCLCAVCSKSMGQDDYSLDLDLDLEAESN